ncbi:transcription elongation factor SPT5-like [Melanerpes formicivorus]|uniref:transcription elongation factor SPT5-like n=1 Tax=Melanerpes formicivorus TaxID=211600 RepID=UPI00358F5B07
MYGKVVAVRHQAVSRKKDNCFAAALDSVQNNIHVQGIIKVIDSPHSVDTSFICEEQTSPKEAIPKQNKPKQTTEAVT